MRFRKRPVEVEAIRYVPGETCEQVAAFMGTEHNCDDCSEWSSWGIETLEGHMEASPGDWIIRGVAGEFYPCKPDIFEATYEPVGATVTDPAFESALRVMCRDEETFRRVRAVVEPEVAALQAQVDALGADLEAVSTDRDRWSRTARGYETLACDAGLL